MKRYCFLPLVVCMTMCAAQTQAMPVGPTTAPALIISVASGCGLGVHRGPYDGCETVYDGNYAGAAVALTIITMSGNTSSGLTAGDSAAGAARTSFATALDYVGSFVTDARPAASRLCA